MLAFPFLLSVAESEALVLSEGHYYWEEGGLPRPQSLENMGERHQATELIQIIFEASLLLPQVSTSRTILESDRRSHCLPPACTEHPQWTPCCLAPPHHNLHLSA